ncbi:Tetratricopeptide repeat protein [Phycisphaerae bacterium RAS1]|nr:Tetratricopeptide repeat protein [Phycisphaerae bacterium RAS1]
MSAALADEAPQRTRVMVAGFAFEGGDARDGWIATAIEETLCWRLRKSPALQVAPRSWAEQSRRELQRGPGAEVRWEDVQRGLGAELWLSARVSGTADAVALQLSLQAVDGTASGHKASGGLLDVIDSATRWTLERLSAAPAEKPLSDLIFAPPARTPSALEYYARAVLAARAEKLDEAARDCRAALEYDNRFRPAIEMLAKLEMLGGPGPRRRAEARLASMLELARAAGDLLDRSSAEAALGLSQQLGGSYDGAMTRYESALALACESGDGFGQVNAMNSICDLLLVRRPPRVDNWSDEDLRAFRHAHVRRAIAWHELVLDGLRGLGDLTGEAPAAGKLAMLWRELGDADAEMAAFDRMLDVATRCGSQRSQAAAWMARGEHFQRLKQWEKAVEAMQKSLELSLDDARPAVQAALGRLYEAMGRPDDALSQYKLAYERLKDTDQFEGQLFCLRRTAELCMAAGRRDEALRALQEAVDLAHVLKLPDEKEMSQKLASWRAR